MKRGASGSTCWIRLTLPDAEFADILDKNQEEKLEEDFGQLEIRKEVDAGDGMPPGDGYAFSIDMSDEAGGPVKGECGYKITRYTETISKGVIRNRDSNGGTEVAEYRNGELVPLEGGKFTLGDQDSILISNIPAGTRYTVREDEDPGKYSTTAMDNQGNVYKNEVSGSIEKRPKTEEGEEDEDALKGIEAVRLTYSFHPRQAAGISATGMTGMEEGAGHGPATCMAIPRRERRQCHSLRGIFSCQPVWRFLFEYGSAYERGPNPARGYPRCPVSRGEGTYRWASMSPFGSMLNTMCCPTYCAIPLANVYLAITIFQQIQREFVPTPILILSLLIFPAFPSMPSSFSSCQKSPSFSACEKIVCLAALFYRFSPPIGRFSFSLFICYSWLINVHAPWGIGIDASLSRGFIIVAGLVRFSAFQPQPE